MKEKPEPVNRCAIPWSAGILAGVLRSSKKKLAGKDAGAPSTCAQAGGSRLCYNIRSST